MNIVKSSIGIAAIAAVATLQAQVVSYTSFVNGSDYDIINQGNAILGPDNLNPIIMGFQFTAGVGGTLDSIRVPTLYGLGNSTVGVALLTNNSDLIGNLMKGWQFTDPGGQHISTLTNSDPSITLEQGTKYWILMSTPGNGVHYWGRSQLGGLMYGMFSSDGLQTNHYGNGDVFSAYEVNVNPVPEPASFAVLGLGALTLIRRRRHLTNLATIDSVS